MTTHLNIGGAWKDVTDIQVNVGGAWKRCDFGYVYESGAWKEFYAYDVTGPGPATSLSATWGNSFGELAYVQWNQPSASDLAYTDLYVNRGAGYVYVGRYTQGPGVQCTYADTTLSFSNVSMAGYIAQQTPVHTYLIRPYDTRGNQGTDATVQTRGYGDSVVRGMIKSPIYLSASSSGTWSGDGYWRSDGGAVYQGRNSYGRHFGHYFYSDTVAWRFNVTSADIITRRISNFGYSSGIPLGLRLSNASAAYPFFSADPLGQIVTGRIDSGDYVWGDSEWTYVPADWAADLVSSTGTDRNSIVFDAEEDSVTGYGFSYRYGKFEAAGTDLGFGIGAGTIRIYHTG